MTSFVRPLHSIRPRIADRALHHPAGDPEPDPAGASTHLRMNFGLHCIPSWYTLCCLGILWDSYHSFHER